MLTNICLLVIAFMLGMNVIFLFLLVKVLKDLVRKSYFANPFDLWGEDVSPDMVADFLSAVTMYYQCKNRGDI